MDKELIKAFLKDIIIKEGLTPDQSSKVMSKYDSIYKGMLKGDKKKLMKYTDPKFNRPNPDAMAMGRAINLVKKDNDQEAVNEARTDLEREYNQYDSFTLDGEVYMIKDIEEYPGNRVQITTEPSSTQDYLTGDSRKSKIFFSDKILKMGGEFHKKKRKQRTTPTWNKGQRSTTKRQYERILKGAMRDAGGEGNEEFTYDMATSMIYDPEISSYLDKEYPRLGRNGKIERLQSDLEMYLQESVMEKKLTKPEKDKKEDIIMSMKKKKGGKDKLTDKDYAIATATAKKVVETKLTELIKTALKGPVKESPFEDSLTEHIFKKLRGNVNEGKLSFDLDGLYLATDIKKLRKFHDILKSVGTDWVKGGYDSEKIKEYLNIWIDKNLKNLSESVLAERILKKLREGKEERTSTVSKSRAKAEVKDIEKGKRSDGMGKPTAKVYAVKDGKEIELKTLKDFNKHSSGYTYKLK